MTVHTYNFGKIKEIVIFDDCDFYKPEGLFHHKKTGRKGSSAPDVSDRDRGIVVARAKKTIRRIALHNKLDRMMTLTTRENITDFELTDKLFKNYIFLLRVKYPDLKYIGTRERQERGAVHYHILIDRFIPHEIAHSTWTSIVDGSVNLKQIRGLRAINYVLKYIGKSFEEGGFIRRSGQRAKLYLVSQGIDRQYKNSREVLTYYLGCEADNRELGEYYNNLQGLLKHGNIVFDRVSTFFVNGFMKTCRSILVEYKEAIT